jgi:hypothetical protein
MDMDGHIKEAIAGRASEGWWDPTANQQAEFCAENGVPQEYAEGWPGGDVPNEPNTWQAVIKALPTDASDELLKSYASMGYTRDGHRASWQESTLATARKKCTQLVTATTPEEQDEIAGEGARNLPTESVRILLLGQSAVASAYFGPLKDNPTISNAANYCVGIAVSSASGAQP